MIPRYHINIFWSDRGECWVADVPDLPGCSTRGGTTAEVVTGIQQAMIDWWTPRRLSADGFPKHAIGPTRSEAN